MTVYVDDARNPFAGLRGDTAKLAQIAGIRARAQAQAAPAAQLIMDGMADPRAPDFPGQGRAHSAPPPAVARSASLDAEKPGRNPVAKPSMAGSAPDGAAPIGEKVRYPTRFATSEPL